MDNGTCDRLLDEHEEGTCAADPHHAQALAAIAARPKGAPSWSAIVPAYDGGGPRDFLDGEPIRCGATLELQAFEYRGDDYHTVKLATGTRVRYERSAGRAVLYAAVGGHTFTTRLQEWMCFRWPRRQD